MKKIIFGATSVAAAAVMAFATAGPANADSVSGWTGPAGFSYLDNSTIINAPNLRAESKIWQTFGASAAPGSIGVRPRLFKSGVLCEARDYVYNTSPAVDLTVGTTATCGTGSYNSHGFVAVWNATNFNYDEYVTFPSNPLNWTAPPSAQAATPQASPNKQSGVNACGQSYGPAAQKKGEKDPQLVLAQATNGKVGYVRSSELNGAKPANPAAASKKANGSRSIDVVSSDGTSVIGSFTIH